ncbi:uncharacterized protein E5676_scaffold255G006520 [Cucumis melo var. makuwa]|uniref:Senescence regulator n=1 Tax=Cucumis melo var. makuwa TaxID=1194695 RepID=A0A5D3CNN0_CUCMM|nr:uncharacterized protein E5676_scaffold255G006520 [Cucumis melo var. makuwa]
MAKGRKLTTSRSERFLGSYTYNNSQGSTGSDSSELGEEDVWPMVDSVETEREEFSEENSLAAYGGGGINISHGGIPVRRGSGVPVDTRERHVGGLSLAFEDPSRMTSARIVHQFRGNDTVASPRGRQMATSAPVNVPDWSKILRVDSVESLQEFDEPLDDPDSEIVPPHEYLARSRKKNATSVFVGVGRTLKGRDLRRVRDAVWMQTGFDG